MTPPSLNLAQPTRWSCRLMVSMSCLTSSCSSHIAPQITISPLLPHLNNPLDILSPHMTMIHLVPKSPPYESSYLHGRLQSPTLTSPPDIFQIAPHGQPLGLSTGSHLGVTIIISWIILLLRLLNTHLVSMLLRNGFIKQT